VQIVLLTVILLTTPLLSATMIKQEDFINQTISISISPSYQKIFEDQNFTILYPRSAIPVIAEPGQSFIIQLQSPVFETLSVSLQTAYDPLPDNYFLSVDDFKNENNIFYITVSIPSNVSEELYNLTISLEAEGNQYIQTRPRAVNVQQTIDDTYTFIQIADFHIGDPRGLAENPKETIGWKAAHKIIEEINLLHPDFVIITGDLTFGQAYPFEYSHEYRLCYDILQEFQVPTYLAPGNHDGYIQTFQDGLKFWQYYFGPLYYSFDYGNNHFLSLNSYDWPKIARFGFSYLVFNWGGSIREEQAQWIEQDLTKHKSSPMLSMMLHHNPLWDTTSDSLLKNGYYGREHLLSLINQYQIDMVLAGHVHYDDVTIQNNTYFITTTTAASSVDDDQGYWGYRMIKIADGQIQSINYKEPKYSIPSYRINQSSINQYSVTVENDLETNISFMKEFIVPNNSYTVNYGEIKQIREKDEMAAVYVTGTIPKETTQMITII